MGYYFLLVAHAPVKSPGVGLDHHGAWKNAPYAVCLKFLLETERLLAPQKRGDSSRLRFLEGTPNNERAFKSRQD